MTKYNTEIQIYATEYIGNCTALKQQLHRYCFLAYSEFADLGQTITDQSESWKISSVPPRKFNWPRNNFPQENIIVGGKWTSQKLMFKDHPKVYKCIYSHMSEIYKLSFHTSDIYKLSFKPVVYPPRV